LKIRIVQAMISRNIVLGHLFARLKKLGFTKKIIIYHGNYEKLLSRLLENERSYRNAVQNCKIYIGFLRTINH